MHAIPSKITVRLLRCKRRANIRTIPVMKRMDTQRLTRMTEHIVAAGCQRRVTKSDGPGRLERVGVNDACHWVLFSVHPLKRPVQIQKAAAFGNQWHPIFNCVAYGGAHSRIL